MLGKLKQVDLKKAWKHEAYDFTTWLAQEENLSMLGDEIGIGIKLIQTEAKVGNFSVDILAEEAENEKPGKIIIENQLEQTDHDHLGKLITYASGHDAKYLIWIVREVREEHRQAIDWLNEHTDDQVNIFAIRIELWQIGDSPMAPKFHIVSQPNDWAKALKKYGGQQSELSETKLLQLEFWTQFKSHVTSNETTLKLRKPQPQHWMDMAYGVAEAQISLTINPDFA